MVPSYVSLKTWAVLINAMITEMILKRLEVNYILFLCFTCLFVCVFFVVDMTVISNECCLPSNRVENYNIAYTDNVTSHTDIVTLHIDNVKSHTDNPTSHTDNVASHIDNVASHTDNVKSHNDVVTSHTDNPTSQNLYCDITHRQCDITLAL